MASRNSYKYKQLASCIFMMFTLLWLTVSAPFIVDIQKKMRFSTTSLADSPQNQSMEEAANPFSGLNEEKCSGNNALSEYLHEPLAFAAPLDVELTHDSQNGACIYLAYYGELLSPPPEL